MLNNFKYSALGLEITKAFEGCRLTAYQDQVDVWTIGYGHTAGGHVRKGDRCTQEQAEAWLVEDVQSCVDAINREAGVTLTQGQFDALVDFAFNLGIGALLRSTLWRKLNACDIAGAAEEFHKWDMAGGKHVPGLLRRRLSEKDRFLTR